jgi:membrane-bound metal-dependent hydrolase YbcI (DUF457 family)
MIYYDHAMLGATLAVAVGAQRRYGWPVVGLAALAGMFPDWDAMSKHLWPTAYALGHRVWGHNLFAATLAGIALGAVGYWIHSSQRPDALSSNDASLRAWILLGVLVLWTHPLLDVLYCGWGRDADWPVRLLWPLVPGGFARPWVPWSDWGATALLGAGLLVCAILPRYRQACAGCNLLALSLYVAARGFLLHVL